MKIFSFVEGANPRRGGIGIVGVHSLMSSLAGRGHKIVLNIAGLPSPGTEQWVQADLGAALGCKMAGGNYGIISFPVILNKWAFSPAMFRALLPHIRGADFIFLNSLYSFPTLAGYLFARSFRKPYLLWLHGVLAPIQRRVSRRRKRIYGWLVAKAILDNAAVIIYTSPGEREETRSLYLRAPSVVIQNGVNVREFTKLPPRGRFVSRYLGGHSGPIVLFLSRINAKKGIDILVRAFALVREKLPTARLAIVGSSDPPKFGDQVMNWIKECKVSDFVVMPGLLVGEEKLQAFADADVFVLPSQAENFGLAIFEAMACRLPVVISDTLDYAKEIDSYQAGLSVPRDPQAFANAIVQVLTNEELHHKLAQNGFNLAEMYSWDKTGEQVDRTLECIAKKRPLPSDLLPQG